MLRLFIIRIIKKRNPFSPDQLHIHHLLNKTLKSNFKTLLVILTIYSLPILLKATININTIFLIISELIVYLGIINTTKGFIIYKRK